MTLTDVSLRAFFSALSYVDFSDPYRRDAAVADAIAAKRMPPATVGYVLNDLGWLITSYHPNDFSGFSATVFANGTEKVLAIRGTEISGLLDTYLDLIKTGSSAESVGERRLG